VRRSNADPGLQKFHPTGDGFVLRLDDGASPPQLPQMGFDDPDRSTI
jgi:hypothetical protein